MSDENGFSEDILSSEDEMGMSKTQHHQVPLGKGWFTGRVYIPETESESGKNSYDDERRDSQWPTLKPLALRFTNKQVLGKKCCPSKSIGKENVSDGANLTRKHPLPLLPRVSVPVSTPGTTPSRYPCPSRTQTSVYTKDHHQTVRSEDTSTSTSTTSDVLKELKKTNEILPTLVNRVEKTEERMEKLENNMYTPSSSSSGSSSSSSGWKPRSSRRKEVPLQVRVR